MKHISNDRIRQLVQVARYYYTEGMTQQQISEKMNISRPNISRMLEQALSSGIVEITIHDPFSQENKFINWFKDTFGLMSVSINKTNEAEGPEYNSIILAAALHDELESSIKDNSSIGVMAGLTISSVSRHILPIKQTGLTFIPLVGGFVNDAKWQANLNARNFGERLNGKYVQFNAPYIVKSESLYKELQKEPEIQKVLEMGQNVSAAIVGIGQMQRNATLINTGLLNASELNEIHKHKVVASICTSFLDARGNIVNSSFSNRIVGMNCTQLRKVPRVIAIAAGTSKTQAITAALLGKWIDVLITDEVTAKSIQDYYYNYIFDRSSLQKPS